MEPDSTYIGFLNFYINEKFSFTNSLFLRMTTSSYINIKISSSY